MTDRVLGEIDRTVARGEPSSLIWAHYFDVHEPYEATTLGTSDVDRYDSELLATDRAIGRLVRETEKRVHKPLVVVITADHGEEFHDHGGVYHGSSLYEEQVHVPLIVLAPGLPPRRVKQPVESIDIAPTLLGMLGIARPSSMRGTDLRALMLQPSATERGPVFSAVIHKKLVVSWPYKLIADLRFGSFELYNLEQDPKERDNRADREPARVQSLRGEVYAWLDSLTPAAGDLNRSAQALEWGRLGDRRAVEALCALLLNDDAGAAARTEAARLLGKLADPAASNALLTATHAHDAWVAAEAAIALGRMFDPQALPALRALVDSEDPGIRSRAAVSLGRLRDRAAVPALIGALWSAPNLYEREEAVRWLGRLGDPAALDPLLNLLPEAHTRHLVVVALGELGDARAFAPLTHVLSWDRNTTVRDGAVRGLAMLGDARALPVLLPLVSEDPALSNTSEALVRLHALERRLIGGVDLSPSTQGVSGFGHCERGPLRQDWDFLHRTSCISERQRSSLTLHIPRRVAEADDGAIALISLKRLDATGSAELELRIGDRLTLPVRVDGAWHELRFPIAKGALPTGSARAELRAITPNARVQLDHVLLVPRTTSGDVAARGG
jgi:HEAT repeat protein